MGSINPEKGEYLKQVRESKSIPLESVHEATKIPMDALRAIEEGYTIRALSDFYLKGFLKIYAEYLGVDVRRVIDDHRTEELPKHIDGRIPEPEYKLNVAVVNFFTPRRKQLLAQIGVILLGFFMLFHFVRFVKGLFVPRSDKTRIVKLRERRAIEREKRKEAARQRAKKVKQAKEESKAEPQPSRKETAVQARQVAAAQAVGDVTLTVRAKKDCWLRVKSDNVVVFQSTLKQGASETWAAKGKIELSGKNINQLEFELNGQMIGALGRSDQRARQLIVTKDGLSVKQ